MDRRLTYLSALTLSMALAGCTVQQPSGSSTTTSVNTMRQQPVSVKAEKRDIVGFDTFAASVYVPQEAQAAVLPPYRAPVEKVFVATGKRVLKGAPLFQVSIPSAEASYDQAKLAVQQAQAAYNSAKVQYGGPLKAAEDQLSQARAAEKQARDQAAVSGDNTQLAQATSARQTAESAVQQAQTELNANMTTYAQQLAAANTALKQARSGHNMSVVRAPISGNIVMLAAVPGQEIGDDAKKPVAEIVDLNDVTVRANLTPEQAGDIKKGDKVTIAFKEIPDKQYTGVVVRVTTSPVVAPNGSQKGVQWQAIISFDNDGYLVKPGMTVSTCGVKTGEVHDVVAVPVGAIGHDSSGKPFVNVLQNQKWAPVVVETGLSDGQYIEIKSGVSDGDTVQVPPASAPR